MKELIIFFILFLVKKNILSSFTLNKSYFHISSKYNQRIKSNNNNNKVLHNYINKNDYSSVGITISKLCKSGLLPNLKITQKYIKHLCIHYNTNDIIILFKKLIKYIFIDFFYCI